MSLPAQPAKRLTVITCMDCRIDPAAVLGFGVGDAHVLRNAGGIVTDDVLRSLALSQKLLGTREVVVMQHTSCGVNAAEEDLREQVGPEPDLRLHGFEDLEASVRAGVRRILDAGYLSDAVRGTVYDIETGELREVS